MGTGISETACEAISFADYFTGREGSARGTQKDYLHFLYIARASLTEAHYFVHLSKRLGYVGDEKHAELESLFRRTFACLLGLIAAVEKESGKLGTAIALITSAVVIGLARMTGSISA